MTLPKNHHRSVKHCPACGKQGHCYDSRHGDAYVRRVYKCDCGEKWTTAEFLIDRGAKLDTHKVRRFWKRKGEEIRKDALLRAEKSIRELL